MGNILKKLLIFAPSTLENFATNPSPFFRGIHRTYQVITRAK
ncbi:hypothetical protein M595_1226 [Lyngbya aestuarii BL J]|uniref:Uncharacterized protein n=1 Tax=Lyngbya aestuarii BL J TaxID=1348334 RepID=U7QN85_9CYAN|nr:hypothetical protein M595_1226 [Lyngbya aestuarii BL J]